MNAYVVTDAEPTFWCYVLAENAGKAKYQAMKADDSGVIRDERMFPNELTVRRFPELDGDTLTEALLVTKANMWTECGGCGRIISMGLVYDDDDDEREGITTPEGEVYCSEACRSRFQARPGSSNFGTARCLYRDV